MSRFRMWSPIAFAALVALAGGGQDAMAEAVPPNPTLPEARQFVARAEAQLLELWIRGQRADWVAETYITGDTELISAQANETIIDATNPIAEKPPVNGVLRLFTSADESLLERLEGTAGRGGATAPAAARP